MLIATVDVAASRCPDKSIVFDACASIGRPRQCQCTLSVGDNQAPGFAWLRNQRHNAAFWGYLKIHIRLRMVVLVFQTDPVCGLVKLSTSWCPRTAKRLYWAQICQFFRLQICLRLKNAVLKPPHPCLWHDLYGRYDGFQRSACARGLKN